MARNHTKLHEALRDVSLSESAVQERFKQARRSGRAAWLWPEITSDAWRSGLKEIERVTRAILTNAAAGKLPSYSDNDLAGFSLAAYTSGMGPLLGYWLETGLIQADDPLTALLSVHLEHSRRRISDLTGETESIAGASSVPLSVLKGLHTAHSYFPDPGTRPIADVDLLTDASHVVSLERVLQQRDYVVHQRQHHPYKSDWRPASHRHTPHSLMFAHADDAWSFDVHTTLDRNLSGVRHVRLQKLFDRARAQLWRDVAKVTVLHQPVLTLLLATHASEGLHNLRLLRLVELALVIRADEASGTLDWEEFTHAARSAGALRFAQPAMVLADALVPGVVPTKVLADLSSDATPAMRRIMATLTPATAQRIDRVSVSERWMWAGSPSEKLRRVLHSIWPEPARYSLKRLGEIYAKRAWSVLRGTLES